MVNEVANQQYQLNQRHVLANILTYITKSAEYSPLDRYIAKELKERVRRHLQDPTPLMHLTYTDREKALLEEAFRLYIESTGSVYKEER